MIYALYIFNSEIKTIKNILPRTCLLFKHATLLALIVLTALFFYIFQFIYFGNNCDHTAEALKECNLSSNLTELFNGLYTIVDALCYALILFMTYKFLIPVENVNIIEKQTSWLRSESKTQENELDQSGFSKPSSTAMISEFNMPVFLSVVNQDVLIDTLEKHFLTTNKEERDVIRSQLQRAQAMLRNADDDMVQPIFASFIDQDSYAFMFSKGNNFKMRPPKRETGQLHSSLLV